MGVGVFACVRVHVTYGCELSKKGKCSSEEKEIMVHSDYEAVFVPLPTLGENFIPAGREKILETYK